MGKKNKSGKKDKASRKKHEQGTTAQDFGGLVVQVARSMRTLLTRNLTESGLYAGQDGVMLALAETDGLTAGQLAARLGVKAPTMTRTIGRMEAQAFVERRADEEDARLTKVYLTAGGRTFLSGIEQAGKAAEARALEGLTDKEVKNLLKLLRTVEENLQKPAETDETP
ncbi:MarR family transcriptional regulator [Rhizobium sp. CFBP 8762]|uniref:MarR family winged helix-turn-helix transcriptional regulator n=1 Tax=Rhizobium sp. CFBP 8762 TaxID=2775279 RepID=UPI001782AC27|nr:MarR family transcriptional regulator [Rhizobium sp. CFBP 8762]MBD8556394.1 MarR family transcriptional regulator [Rhizobium sp. CFBP 8762]